MKWNHAPENIAIVTSINQGITHAGVNQRGDWSAWLAYFFDGVARQSEDALSRAGRINRKLAQWRKEVTGIASKTPGMLIDMLASNPYVTINQVVKRLGVAFTTAQRAVEKVGDAKRDRVYCAKSILAILDEPARLVPSN